MRKALRYLMIVLSTIFLMAGGAVVFALFDSSSFNAVEYCQENIGNSGDLIDQEKLGKCVEDMWKVEGIMPLIGILGGILIMLGLTFLWFGLRIKTRQIEN